MGAIFQTRQDLIAEGLIKGFVNSIIKADRDSRRGDEDMYRGDFGSSDFVGYSTLPYKRKTEEGKEKLLREFLNEEARRTKKYEVRAVVCDDAGYLAYKIGFRKNPSVKSIRGKVHLVHYKGLYTRPFKNITELKRFLNTTSVSILQEFYGMVVEDENCNRIGSIGSIDQKIYKTKPKTCPKKYTAVDKLCKIVIYGWCPY